MNDGAEWKPPIAPPRALASLILTSASTRSIQWMKDPCNDNRSGTIAISNGKGPVAPPDDLARYAMLLTGRCQSPLTKGGHSLKTSKLWRCCECECTFSSKGALTVHVLQTQHGIHFDGKGKCSKRSNSASTTGAGRNNLEKYCCIQCGARYRSTQALGLHNAVSSGVRNSTQGDSMRAKALTDTYAILDQRWFAAVDGASIVRTHQM